MARVFFWFGAIILLLLIAVGSYPAFRLLGLYLGSHIEQTSHGKIEMDRQGEGPPVLVVHGLLGGYDQGLLFGDVLVKNGFEVISVSRPGYLRTPLATGVTFDEQTDALAALLDNLKISKVIVMGISSGGPVAIELALRHPERVAGLVLFSAVTGSRAPDQAAAQNFAHHARGRKVHPFKWNVYSVWGSLVARLDPKKALIRTLAVTELPGKKDQDAVVSSVLSSPERRAYFDRMVDTVFPISGKVNGIRNDLKQLALLPELPLEKITVPTLIIHGEEDRLVPFAGALAAQKKIPGSVLLAVPGAGHLVQLGPHDQEVDATLVGFCRKVYRK